jgi:quinol-cytochrome oxidoreductase complex cytochrome b subunit
MKIFQQPQGSKARIRAVSKNFFLHFHSPKIHAYTLQPFFSYGLGVINLALFLILLTTGILLMFYYKPHEEAAYYSILDINNIVLGGRYLRNMHRWAAHGLVFVALLHMTRTFFTAAYRGGQRMTWHLGVGLLLVTLFASFSGYLLPWDQLGFWAVTIASNILGSTREITDLLHITSFFDPGLILKKLLLGGTDVTQESLTRFYTLHIVFLPLCFVLLMGLHFWRIRKNGGLNLPDKADEYVISGHTTDPGHNNSSHDQRLFSWPVALWAELGVIFTTLALITVFALLIDAPLREIANAALPENPAKAPWFFLGVQELVSYSAFAGGILVPLFVIIFLFAIPYLDPQKELTGIWFSGKSGLKIALVSLLFALATDTILMLIVYFFGWIRDWIPSVPYWLLFLLNPGIMAGALFVLYAFLSLKKTRSRRLALIALYSCLLLSYAYFTFIGIWARGYDWQFILF